MEAVFAHIEKYEPAFMRMSERLHAGRKKFLFFLRKKNFASMAKPLFGAF